MIALSVGNDGQFQTFCNAVGQDEWADDTRFARNRDRVENLDACDTMISALLKTDDTQAWLDKLQSAGVSCAPINTVAQALTAEHTIARGLVTKAVHSVEGEIDLPGIPFRFSDSPAAIRRAPPTLGEHTEEVLREIGKTDAEINALRDSGAI